MREALFEYSAKLGNSGFYPKFAPTNREAVLTYALPSDSHLGMMIRSPNDQTRSSRSLALRSGLIPHQLKHLPRVREPQLAGVMQA
jgi:hypothetical protein